MLFSPRCLFLLVAFFLFLTGSADAMNKKQITAQHFTSASFSLKHQSIGTDNFDFFIAAIDDDDDDDLVIGKKRVSRFFALYEGKALFCGFVLNDSGKLPVPEFAKDMDRLPDPALNNNTCMRV